MSNCLPWDNGATDTDGRNTASPARPQVGRYLIVAMLLTAAALDLTRCGLVLAAARHPAPAAGLVTAGLAAAALTARTARGCQAGQRWAGWAALLIGGASAPQAAVSGFGGSYAIPDTATAALGILLAITILATAGRMGRRATAPCGDRESCSLMTGRRGTTGATERAGFLPPPSTFPCRQSVRASIRPEERRGQGPTRDSHGSDPRG